MRLTDIYLLVFLYEVGINKSLLGRFFDKDHSTVIHHIKKYGAVQVKALPVPKLNDVVTEEVTPKASALGIRPYTEKINRGKHYAEYLAEENKRVRKEKALVNKQKREGTFVPRNVKDYFAIHLSSDFIHPAFD